MTDYSMQISELHRDTLIVQDGSVGIEAFAQGSGPLVFTAALAWAWRRRLR